MSENYESITRSLGILCGYGSSVPTTDARHREVHEAAQAVTRAIRTGALAVKGIAIYHPAHETDGFNEDPDRPPAHS